MITNTGTVSAATYDSGTGECSGVVTGIDIAYDLNYDINTK